MTVTLIRLVLCTTEDYILNNKMHKGAITMVLIGMARNKTPGAQLHTMVNIPVQFHDCGSHTRHKILDGHKDRRTERQKGKHICPFLSQWGHNSI
jgi:hypothetical protein